MWLGDGGEVSGLAKEVVGGEGGSYKCRNQCPRGGSQDSGDHNGGNIDREGAQ